MSEVKEMLSAKENEKVIEVEIERLKEFKDHPFKVQDDLQMTQLKESIAQYGILNPLIVRPIPEGAYEIISGHRRKYAAEQLGYRKVPVIIRVMQDDESIISMVDSNLQREQISPSEKAFAYKMKYEATIRAKKKNGGQLDHAKGKRTIQIVGEEVGESPKQVQRYIKITDLIPELMEKLDDGLIAFNPAVEISYLTAEEQQTFLEVMNYTQSRPSLSQAQRIKELSNNGDVSFDDIEDILSEVKPGDATRVVFKTAQLHRYFPKSYTAEKMKREILDILKLSLGTYWDEE